jgi:hypothetical protein
MLGRTLGAETLPSGSLRPLENLDKTNVQILFRRKIVGRQDHMPRVGTFDRPIPTKAHVRVRGIHRENKILDRAIPRIRRHQYEIQPIDFGSAAMVVSLPSSSKAAKSTKALPASWHGLESRDDRDDLDTKDFRIPQGIFVTLHFTAQLIRCCCALGLCADKGNTGADARDW